MFSTTTARSLLVRVGVTTFAGAVVFGGASVFASHEDLEFPAAIHEGTCEEPGDEVVALDNLVRLPEGAPVEGDPVGAPGAQVVHGSPEGSTLDLTLEDLLADDHILAVFDAEGEEIVACGPIGAYTMDEEDDSLAIGLRSQGESPYSGVALFEGTDDDLGFEVYLVNNTPAPAATPIA